PAEKTFRDILVGSRDDHRDVEVFSLQVIRRRRTQLGTRLVMQYILHQEGTGTTSACARSSFLTLTRSPRRPCRLSVGAGALVAAACEVRWRATSYACR